MRARLVLVAALLMGCSHRPQATRAEVRDCITGGEPVTAADWLSLTLECTE